MKRFLKEINYFKVFVLASIIGLLIWISFIAQICKSDGGEGVVVDIISSLFYILAFPFLYIAYLIKQVGSESLIIGTILNSIFWAIRIERFFYHKTKASTKVKARRG